MLQSCTCLERPESHPGSFGGGDLRKRLKKNYVGKVRLADVQPKLDSEGLHHLILRSAKRPARTIYEFALYREIFFWGAAWYQAIIEQLAESFPFFAPRHTFVGAGLPANEGITNAGSARRSNFLDQILQ